MKIERQLSAVQLATGVILGGIMAACGFVAAIPQYSGIQSREARIVVSFTVIILGLVISLSAGSSLTNGMQVSRWPEETIQTVRAHLESPWLVVLAVVVMFSGCLMLAFDAGNPHRGLFWPALVLSQTISRLQTAVKRPPETPEPMDWRNGSPLYSEHWGER